MASTIPSVKGTRDFYPEEMSFRRWLGKNIQAVSEQFGYQEYDGPFLERIDLYAAKSGEELVKEQSFVFPDRGGDLIALRPELTPSLARMVASRRNLLPRTIRWWSFGPFWRYERPQKGRGREFFQWNIDLLGVDTPQADAEIAAIGAAFFQRVGLSPKQVRIKFNNRRLVDKQLGDLGVPAEQRGGIFHLVDRRDKMNANAWEKYALELGLSSVQFSNLCLLLEQSDAWEESEELTAFIKALSDLGYDEYFEYDPTVIRGLDYYTGTVFEARDAAGTLRAVLGGGRYDNLVADVGGDPVAGVGFAMGDMVLRVLLEEEGLIPSLRSNPADILLATFDESCWSAALALASDLRSNGLRVEWYPEATRISKQLKYAGQQGMPFAIILGTDEIESRTAAVKNLVTREQENVPFDRTAEFVLKQLAGEKGSHPA